MARPTLTYVHGPWACDACLMRTLAVHVSRSETADVIIVIAIGVLLLPDAHAKIVIVDIVVNANVVPACALAPAE